MNNKRLNAISEIFDNELVIDIGSDHGYLPLDLLKKNKVKNAIIIEVNQGPLENAISNIRKFGFSLNCRTLLSNGLQKLEIEAIENAGIVVAGMGGKLISEIISNDLEKFKKAKLYLQPNNNEAQLRQYLMDNGFQVLNDLIIEDEGIIYEIIVAEAGLANLSNEQIIFGLNIDQNPLFEIKYKEQLEYLKPLILKIRDTGNRNDKLENEYALICSKLGVENEIN